MLGLGLCVAGYSAAALPETALRFNGVNSYASVAHNAALNAYPLTVTAWVHCLANSGAYQTIVSKYTNSSFDGWAMQITPSGQLRGFYYRGGSGANKAIDNSAGSGPVIADGLWHHAALVIGTNGGQLFLDGNLLVSNTWSGVAGAITNTKPLVFSGLNDGSSPLNGDVDEATIWTRALTVNELNFLKHRQLRGVEDDLVSYWKFDDGLGLTATDATANHFNASLVNSPAWVPSGAAVDLSMIPTNCVKFSGTVGIVSITNAPDLNPYPFTATAWFRTTNATSLQVITAKYADSSYNGWALAVAGGQLRGFLYRNGSLANKAIDATAGPVVADGGWHHAVLLVDTNGGRIFLDGNLLANNAWSGAAGAVSSTTPLTIGALTNAPPNNYPYFGDVDEVTLWSRALSTTEIAAQKNLPLAGTEANLVGYWRLDETSGTATFDATTNAHTGALSGTVTRTGSTAYLGDGTTHLVPSFDYATLGFPFAITGSPTESAFNQKAGVTFSRFYDYGSAPGAENASAIFDYSLQTSTGTPIPLLSSEVILPTNLGAQLASAPRTNTAANGWLSTVAILPAVPNGVQLNSVDNLHRFVTTLSHNENGGGLTLDSTNMTAAMRLLHFDGNLFCGPLLTLFNNLDSAPVVGTVVAGNHLDCSLTISASAGSIPGTSYTFGDGSSLSVSLALNGDCTLKSGIITPFGLANDTDTIQNISFQRAGLTLGTNGASAIVVLDLPAGLGVRLNLAGTRLMTNTLVFPAQLDASLRPATNVLSAPFAQLAFSAETLPCWIKTTQFSWRVYDGQLVIPANSVEFARQFEDDVLTANRSSLVDTNLANRISNDAYFRNAQPAPSPGFVITADTNGFAQVNGSIALSPPELRPHFPYTDTQPGSQVPTTNGLLTLQNSLIDPGSYLALTTAVPLLYSRDCTDTNCSGATAGLATVNLAPPAYQLSFTPDGGLLGYGPVSTPLTPDGVALTWGFNSTGVYAQQTSIVGNGVYEMAGNFLRGDQSAVSNSQRAVTLLFTGWGSDTNVNYLERPGTPDYANGFANYAGVNLRTPAQGRSTIANVDSGWYPLTPRAKYYARNGGVSGIHEAASFPTNFFLYGYAFNFSSYRLSYLDSENWESRTDGGITFPLQPAGFSIGFARMKFVCSGGLGTAQLPAGTGPKKLNYWNAWFTPQSIQFKPRATEQCSTADRTLVLGAELRLPLITNAMHAMLGFKTNGNLSTVADNVLGTDSRFPLPKTLSLQGSGANVYPISVGSEGYFNNWEAANRPDAGFFNIAGIIGVPFFKGFKAHLQVTPTGSDYTSADIAIAGGWPLADSPGTNFGWTAGGQNYFNTKKFDPNCAGWPGGITLANYLNSPTEQYHPRAQRLWKNLAFFDYPLSWIPVLRHFEGFNSGTLSLPILDVGSKLKLLSATKVDCDFNQDLNLALPHIKQLDFINETVDGPFNTISNAIYEQLHGAADATGITKGLQSLQGVLGPDPSGFFGPILDGALDGIAGNLVTNLTALETANPATVLQQLQSTFINADAQFKSAISKINGTANDINSVIGKIDGTFSDVTNTVALLLRIIQKDSTGNRNIVRTIVEKLMEQQPDVLQTISEDQAGDIDGFVNDQLADFESDFESLESDLKDLQSQLADVQSGIASATGPVVDALNSITNETANISLFEQQAFLNVSNSLAGELTAAGDYFKANPTAARTNLRNRLKDAFLHSDLTRDYQTKFKQFAGDDDFVLNQLLCLLTDKINGAVRSAIEDYIAGTGDKIYQTMKGIGQLQKTLATAKLRGQPTFNGDSLDMIHLDADLEIKMPDAMHYNAYIEIKSQDSQSGALACAQGGDSAAEIILGANKVPLDWPGVKNTGITLTANARWTMDRGTVTGVGGLMELEGKADFEGFSLRHLGATFAVGNSDNYFAGKAEVVVFIGPVPVNLNAGIFSGQSCSLDPILFVDTNAPAIIGNISGFSGFYSKIGGGISLSDLLFGHSSCLLNADARITFVDYFLGGPSSANFGHWERREVDFSLLCLVSGSFGQSLSGQVTKDASGYHLELTGSGDACAEVGIDPFSVKKCETITIKGILKEGGVDYQLDY